MSLKQLFLLPFIILCFAANATTYYFSASGNDANKGTSALTPWKTLAKFNSVFASEGAGDKFLFKRGDEFYGSIVINRSGSSNAPIIIGAYGTGTNPVITGFTTVSAWTKLGNNIWESTSAVSNLPTCNMVTINRVNTAMGRTPNYPAYYIWESRVGNTSITSSSLNSAVTNWAGAELAFFTTTYRINRHPITAHSGSTITYNSTGNADFFQSPQSYFVQNFLIQNDARTLDVQNEWYYNPNTKKLRIYSANSPTNVQMATVDTLVWTGIFKDWITFENLSFQGSNQDAIELGASKNIKIQNCTFNFLGKNAIYGANWGSPGYPNLRIENCTINNANNCGIDVSRWFFNATIRNNTIKNIGMLIGMGSPTSANLTVTDAMSTGIRAIGANGIIAYNTTDSTGYVGIKFVNSNTSINNNFVSHFCIGNGIKDGGGIYTVNGSDTAITGIKIFNNIVLNSGAFSQGIYCDDKSNGIEVYNNTSANCERGIYIHNSWNMNVHDNTSYANDYALLVNNEDPSVTPSNIRIKNNIFFAKTSSQFAAYFGPLERIIPALTADSNYFVRPIDDSLTIYVKYNKASVFKTLAQLKTITGQDANSGKLRKTVTNVNDIRFEYNATTVNKTIILDGNYTDVRNVPYNGSIRLAPYTSAILIRNDKAGGAANPSPGRAINILLCWNKLIQILSNIFNFFSVSLHDFQKAASFRSR